MRNNRGFSLIEIIVVITISSIMIIGVSISVNVISRANVKQCVSALNDELTKLRMESMSKSGQHQLVLSKTGTKLSLTYQRYDQATGGWNQISSRELGEFTVEKRNDTGDFQEVSTVVFEFERSSGSVVNGDGVYNITGKGSTMQLTLVKLSGKHFYE